MFCYLTFSILCLWLKDLDSAIKENNFVVFPKLSNQAVLTGFEPAIMREALRGKTSNFGNLLASRAANHKATLHKA